MLLTARAYRSSRAIAILLSRPLSHPTGQSSRRCRPTGQLGSGMLPMAYAYRSSGTLADRCILWLSPLIQRSSRRHIEKPSRSGTLVAAYAYGRSRAITVASIALLIPPTRHDWHQHLTTAQSRSGMLAVAPVYRRSRLVEHFPA